MASVTLNRHVLADTLGGIVSFSDSLAQGDITIDGDQAVVLELFDLLTDFLLFPIIEPHADQEQ